MQLNQEQYNLPIYIPTYTNKYRCKKAFSDFVAVDIQKLFNCRKGKGATLKPIFKTETDVRRHFNVTPECLLIVILNGSGLQVGQTGYLGNVIFLGANTYTGGTTISGGFRPTSDGHG